MKDYYKVLGVSPGAPAEVIKAAYRALIKIHHPDVGGDPKMAMAIEEAYRHLSGAIAPHNSMPQIRRSPKTPMASKGAIQPWGMIKGQNIDIEVLEFLQNQVFTCPKGCSFHGRNCRYKQQLSVESKDFFAFRASTLKLLIRNKMSFAQQIDCRSGRAAIIDQMGDFYHCQTVCTWQHSPKYKEASVEMFPNTQATLLLWFPQIPPGRFIQRFVYKHKLILRDQNSDWFSEELLELPIKK